MDVKNGCVFVVKFHFTFGIFFLHLTLFHFISWLLRTALNVGIISPRELIDTLSCQLNPSARFFSRPGISSARCPRVPDVAMRSLLEPAEKLLGEQYAAIGILEEWENSLELFNVALGFPNFNWTTEFLALGEQNKVDDEAHRFVESDGDSRLHRLDKLLSHETFEALSVCLTPISYTPSPRPSGRSCRVVESHSSGHRRGEEGDWPRERAKKRAMVEQKSRPYKRRKKLAFTIVILRN